jgi:hypothetical protein
LFVAAAAVLVLYGVFAARASASDLIVTTATGDVEGVIGPSGKEWRGVPYAAPPVGDLRWRPPAPVTPWSGVRDATNFASPCIQLAFPTGTFGSEDCLYLNVFVPANASAEADLPVMVHLHPGGNFFGAPYTEAGTFTSRGVILVTVGYRLGVLGFMGHPALTAEGHSGEYGVLDQVAALRWVHDNIAAFGGDPARVTLFGSSAGSFDTVAIMTQNLSAAGVDAFFRPRVAVDADGDAVFAWERRDGSNFRVQARTLSTAGVLSSTQNLTANGPGNEDPQVAVDADGDAVFTWQRFDGTISGSRRGRSAAGVLGSTQNLSAAAPDAFFASQIVIDTLGDASVTWQRSDGTKHAHPGRFRAVANN